MTEMEFEEVFKRALEIQYHHFSSKEASKMNQLAMSFGDGSYNELTLTEAAYILNATSMDMSGRYIESGVLLVKDYYIENINIKEEEDSVIREINDYILVCQNNFTYSNEKVENRRIFPQQKADISI